jgi:hypothetical protein
MAQPPKPQQVNVESAGGTDNVNRYDLIETKFDVPNLVQHCPKRMRYKFRSVLDQKNSHTCVPLCVADLMDWYVQESRRAATTSSGCSAEMIYDLRRCLQNQGMKCSDALEIVKRYGCWSANDYTKFSTTFARPDSAAAQQIRQDKLKELLALRVQHGSHGTGSSLPRTIRVVDYYRVSTLSGVKFALARFGPCVMVTPHYNTSSTFWKPNTRQYIRYLLKKQRLSKASSDVDWQTQIDALEHSLDLVPSPKRFHCLIVAGYDSAGLIFKNSWGSKWSSHQGYCVFPFTDFNKYATEIWVFPDVIER